MVTIRKDATGITFEYILSLKGRDILQGDGWESRAEILTFLKEIVEAVKGEYYL